MLKELSRTDVFLILTGILIIPSVLYIILISLKENEKRAAFRVFILLPLLTFLFIGPVFISGGEIPGIFILCIFWGFILLLIFPTRPFERKIERSMPKGQINEKNVMFSRKLLEPGTDRYTEYYRNFPEHEVGDNIFRSKPGLLSKDSAFYDPFTFNASQAIFEAITSFYPIVDGNPADERQALDVAEISTYLREWILKEGAVSVGFTETRDYHWYSEIGRGTDFGKEAQLPHKYAIAFTVEMDKQMMDTAPAGPVVMESARQYMNAAVIATDVAKFIRRLGYNARAHIDGNYRLVCPLLARDAGLGEIGRMGLLMTPELGPRVRIGVITTDMPLPPSAVRDFSDVIKFCRICKKCADVCPSRAIPFDNREDINGVKRWQINQESCYTYWCIAGTDCGKCMSACPYAHPNNFFHNVVRVLLRNSIVFRYFALKSDDFFYGRKPKAKPIPDWLTKSK